MRALTERLWRKEPPIAFFALLGGFSGSVSTGSLIIIFISSGFLEVRGIAILPLFLMYFFPGMVFGLLIGLALIRRRLASREALVRYCIASSASYFAAFMVFFLSTKAIDSILFGGMAAGLVGATCLTVASAAIFPFARRLGPCLRMVIAGGLLGATFAPLDLLPEPLVGVIWGMIPFHATWQAGYAAAFAMTLPRTAGEA